MRERLTGAGARARKRVGRKHFDTYAFTGLQLIAGSFTGFDGDNGNLLDGELSPEQIVERAMGNTSAEADSFGLRREP